MKVVLIGIGWVGKGVAFVLCDMGLCEVEFDDFLNNSYDEVVFIVLACVDYVVCKDGKFF